MWDDRTETGQLFADLIYLIVFSIARGFQFLLNIIKLRNQQLDNSNATIALMQKEKNLASQTHDTVTGKLTYITLPAQKNIDLYKQNLGRIDSSSSNYADTPPTDIKSRLHDWEEANTTALMTLDNVHHVIDILNSADAGSKTAEWESTHQFTSDSFLAKIKEISSLESQHLLSLGFHGDVTINNKRLCPTNSVESPANTAGSFCINSDSNKNGNEIMAISDDKPRTDSVPTKACNLLTEIFTNIAKYANPGEPYHIIISYQGKTVTITRTNHLKEHSTSANNSHDSLKTSSIPSNHQGLQFHTAWVEEEGGKISYSAEEGQWVLFAEVPVK